MFPLTCAHLRDLVCQSRGAIPFPISNTPSHLVPNGSEKRPDGAWATARGICRIANTAHALDFLEGEDCDAAKERKNNPREEGVNTASAAQGTDNVLTNPISVRKMLTIDFDPHSYK